MQIVAKPLNLLAVECPSCGYPEARITSAEFRGVTVGGKQRGAIVRNCYCDQCGKTFAHAAKIDEDAKGIFCKRCGCQKFKVTNTVPIVGGVIQRRRRCLNCGLKRKTEER